VISRFLFRKPDILVMGLRHLFSATLVIAVFTIGMANVITDGMIAHEIRSEFPNHAGEGNVSIEDIDPISIEKGESKLSSIQIENARTISYKRPEKENISGISLDLSLLPPPSYGEDSLPPSYFYDHQEKSVKTTLNVSADKDVGSGNYSFSIIASPEENGSRESEEEFTVVVE